MHLSRALLAAVILAIAVPVCAQSLGDLAKKEQERRKASPPATKTYTNEDLKKLPPMPDSFTSPAAKPTKVEDPAKPVAAKGETAAPPEPAKDEKYWHDRITAVREEIRRNESFRDALQSQINALSADFVGRDDPVQRAKIGEDRQKALAEHARVKEEIAKATKQITDIEEEARRAGVPSGWLR